MPSPAVPTFDYAAAACRVIDGDTVAVSLIHTSDMGFGGSSVNTLPEQRIRLAGLDCKPLHTPRGDAAAAWLAERTAGTLRVVTVKNAAGRDKHEKYGRFLAFLFAGEEPSSLNEQMVAAGLAVPWDGHGGHPTGE
jgi:endonuclease YncB( thermonuclease family)